MNNQITLIGRVGQNPSSVSFADTNNKVVKFSIAVKDYSSNADEDKTEWFDVDAWNGLGDRVLAIVTKGREVAVWGRLKINHFNKEINGVTVSMEKPVIKLTGFHLCGSKPKAEETISEEKSPPRRRKLAAV
jgi:single stranded DNA-binding protein